MLEKTKGVVINYIRYRDTSIITKIFTEELGLQTYIVNGIRSSGKRKSKIALFQPLTLLDLVVYYEKDKDKIFRISEVKCHQPFVSIPFHYQKSAVAMFLSEILSKTLRDESENKALFHFLYESFSHLDQEDCQVNAFPIHFLLKLTRFLGFEPQNAQEIFRQLEEFHPLDFSQEELPQVEKSLNDLLQNYYSITHSSLLLPHSSLLLDSILNFYRLHIDSLKELKSLTVLRAMRD